jgi:signal peptidase I
MKSLSLTFKITALILLAVLTIIGLGYINGLRTFIVETPSMGTYSPVGTFVVSKPVQIKDLAVGDTLAFHPPGAESTFFHRVHEVTDEGLKTKGDLNGSVDPWVVNAQDQIVGKELLHVQNLGFLLRVLPLLIVGGLVLHLITSYFSARYYRFPIRVMGWYLLVSVAALITKPYFNASLISQSVKDDSATTLFVGTGIFNIKGTAEQGTSSISSPGELVSVVSSYANDDGYYNVLLQPHLGFYNWVLLVAIWLLPTLLCVVYAVWARKTDRDLKEPVESDSNVIVPPRHITRNSKPKHRLV